MDEIKALLVNKLVSIAKSPEAQADMELLEAKIATAVEAHLSAIGIDKQAAKCLHYTIDIIAVAALVACKLGLL